jgi:hypothetical protein
MMKMTINEILDWIEQMLAVFFENIFMIEILFLESISRLFKFFC